MMRQRAATRSAFGLLEVLLSAAIFIVVVGGMVTLNRLALRNAVLANHRTQAYNLAEDALESVRQIRDSNWISPPLGGNINAPIPVSERWKAFVHSCTGSNANDYSIPVASTSYTTCYNANTRKFGLVSIIGTNNETRLGPTTGQFDPGATTFKTVLTVTPLAAGDLQLLTGNSVNQATISAANYESAHFVKVKSVVQWKDFDQDWSVEVSTILSNWKAR